VSPAVQSGTRGSRINQLRILGILAVFLLGLGAFFSGVDTTGVTDPQDQHFLAWLYQTAGLFVFGGLDLGAPTGGPLLGRAALWVAYFLAPLITTTAVVEALLRLVRPDWLQRQALKGHIILAGTGRVGLAYLEAIRAVEPNRTVALVDSGEGLATEAEVLKLGRTEILRGDIRRPGTLEALRLDRADRMIVLTDDDMANLEMAWGGKERAPELPIAVHVADLTLLRPVNRIVKEHREMDGPSSPLIFNTARIAALNLFDQHLYPHFQDTGQLDILVIGGFGRFGQTILELLRVMAAEELERVVVVDREAARKLRQFQADVHLEALEFSTVDGDLTDPGTWTKVECILEESGAEPVFLLASPEEVVNFRAAMLLRGRSKEPRVFARCFHRTRFAESLASQLSFDLLVFEDVLREALKEHYEGLLSV
jgi:Trk K+ transport system NAD-binding subunit